MNKMELHPQKKRAIKKSLAVVGAGVLAANTAACNAENGSSNTDKTDEPIKKEYRQTDKERIEARRAFREQQRTEGERGKEKGLERVRDLAKQMNIYNSRIEKNGVTEELRAEYIGGVPTVINGVTVPKELYTPEDLERVQFAKNVGNMMDQTEQMMDEKRGRTPRPPNQAEHKTGNNKPIESMPIDTSAY